MSLFHLHGWSRFKKDIAEGTLPAFSWVNPRWYVRALWGLFVLAWCARVGALTCACARACVCVCVCCVLFCSRACRALLLTTNLKVREQDHQRGLQ